jgi:hypothetical protein
MIFDLEGGKKRRRKIPGSDKTSALRRGEVRRYEAIFWRSDSACIPQRRFGELFTLTAPFGILYPPAAQHPLCICRLRSIGHRDGFCGVPHFLIGFQRRCTSWRRGSCFKKILMASNVLFRDCRSGTHRTGWIYLCMRGNGMVGFADWDVRLSWTGNGCRCLSLGLFSCGRRHLSLFNRIG